MLKFRFFLILTKYNNDFPKFSWIIVSAIERRQKKKEKNNPIMSTPSYVLSKTSS